MYQLRYEKMKSILVLDAQSFASDICNKEFKVKGLCFIVTFDYSPFIFLISKRYLFLYIHLIWNTIGW